MYNWSREKATETLRGVAWHDISAQPDTGIGVDATPDTWALNYNAINHLLTRRT